MNKKIVLNGVRRIINRINWSDVKAESSWRIFKEMSELVEGFEKLNKIGPCISIFGSARSKP